MAESYIADAIRKGAPRYGVEETQQVLPLRSFR
jgi:hypothetical protein